MERSDERDTMTTSESRLLGLADCLRRIAGRAEALNDAHFISFGGSLREEADFLLREAARSAGGVVEDCQHPEGRIINMGGWPRYCDLCKKYLPLAPAPTRPTRGEECDHFGAINYWDSAGIKYCTRCDGPIPEPRTHPGADSQPPNIDALNRVARPEEPARAAGDQRRPKGTEDVEPGAECPEAPTPLETVAPSPERKQVIADLGKQADRIRTATLAAEVRAAIDYFHARCVTMANASTHPHQGRHWAALRAFLESHLGDLDLPPEGKPVDAIGDEIDALAVPTPQDASHVPPIPLLERRGMLDGCGVCGGPLTSYRGGCPLCGAPNCCEACCRKEHSPSPSPSPSPSQEGRAGELRETDAGGWAWLEIEGEPAPKHSPLFGKACVRIPDGHYIAGRRVGTEATIPLAKRLRSLAFHIGETHSADGEDRRTVEGAADLIDRLTTVNADLVAEIARLQSAGGEKT